MAIKGNLNEGCLQFGAAKSPRPSDKPLDAVSRALLRHRGDGVGGGVNGLYISWTLERGSLNEKIGLSKK